MEGVVKYGYKFGKVLGSGGGGVVYKVTKDGKVFAVKVVKKNDVEENFANNIKIDSPFLVKYLDTFSDDVLLVYIVMEYCEGGDLKTLLNRNEGKRFDSEKIMKIYLQLLVALNELHKNHIFHRDIKPENVFLTKGDNLKLGDFGCFKVLAHTSSGTQTLKGTTPFMSPEAFHGKYGFKSDVWALGVLMYLLCTGNLPFRAASEYLLPVAIVENDFQPIRGGFYPTELVNAIHSMLTKKEDDRPSIGDLMKLPFVSENACKLGLEIVSERKYGSYSVIKEIGRGGYGRVFLGKHIQTKEICALKVMLLHDMLEKDDALEMAAQAEMQIGMKVGKLCPFFVRYDEMFAKGNECVFVMEFCAGGNLRRQIKERANTGKLFDEPDLLRVLYQVGTALKVLHTAKVVHNGVKPENIFITEDGTYKLGDFGEAQYISKNMHNRCTWGYAAPEIIEEKPNYDASADIYALGCVLLEMINLQHPFGNVGISYMLVLKMMETKPEVSSVKAAHYKPALVDLGMRMMSKKQSDRPAIDEVLLFTSTFGKLK